ncbi:porin family protein [Parabacteroides sp. PF5-6]|uniref:porin family protein n=1 Tax=Parabacteroides sp. PF5-6 TaxID=1742403 RepID=UPI002406495D|nr:porin family protein [Parabacteroides sp. PF5-6]MDF9829418.1 hypothetical protein [Parabacteroides sp. PF5-6]
MKNIRRYTFLFVCLIAFLGVRAQNTFQREFAVGFGGGVNFSQIGFTPKVNQGYLQGLHGGVTVRWITNKNLGLTAEINFAQQGWQEDFSESTDGAHFNYSRTINYVELPFMTHIYAGNGRARFIFNVGPKLGYALSESTDTNLGGATPGNHRNEQHDMPLENKLDWGICGGPGVELRTGLGTFLLEGRIYFALGNIYGNSKADFFPKSNGMTFSAKLSYLIRVK